MIINSSYATTRAYNMSTGFKCLVFAEYRLMRRDLPRATVRGIITVLLSAGELSPMTMIERYPK